MGDATVEALWGDQGILDLISNERKAQDDKWGVQSHPDGTVNDEWAHRRANIAKAWVAESVAANDLTWYDILIEEVYEAAAETEPEKLKAELIQIAAVCAAWVQDIESRA